MVVWFNNNIVPYVNALSICQVGLVLSRMTIDGYTVSVFNQATQSNSARPTIPPWVGVVSTGEGYSHC